MKDWKEVFSRLEPKFSRALDLAGNTHLISDLHDKIADGRLKIFHTDEAMVLNEVYEYPRCRALNIFMAAGKLDSVLTMEPIVVRWAKENGCDRGYFIGREGWIPTLEPLGWRPTLRLLEKRF